MRVIPRRAFLAGSGALCLVSPAAWAQSESRVYRIGLLGSGPVASVTAPPDALLGAFLGRLQELGYAEGRNLVFERRTAEGRNERYRALATELANLRVDLILAPGTAAALAAKDATSTIPIVTVVVGDPVGSGLVVSLGRPGGNVTGMSSAASDVGVKQLELIKEILPHLSSIVVLWNRTTALHVSMLKHLEVAARKLRVRLHPVDVRTPHDLETAFTAIVKERPGALMPLDDSMIYQERRRIADFALQHRLPTASFQRSFTEAGTLLSYGPSFADLFRGAASYVDKILKGAKPADLPIQQPTTFELVINLKTAKALGLTIPPSLLLRADEVIE